jgi:hypothetical protein
MVNFLSPTTRVTVAVDPGVLGLVGRPEDGAPLFRIFGVAIVNGMLSLLIVRAVSTDEGSG